MENIIKDERFFNISKDPRFRSIPKKEKKVVVDKRFQSMFHEKNFKLKYSMDKRGRKVTHSTAEDLKKFYHVESSDDSEHESSKTKVNIEKCDKLKHLLKNEKRDNCDLFADSKLSFERTTEVASLSDDDAYLENDGPKKEVDLARGEGTVETSSSDDEETDQDSDNEVDHKWGELDAETPRVEEATHRLAVCNMNWDRIKADDLFILFNSFKPLEGSIVSVKIYPSDYGKERMKAEELKGPMELVERKDICDNPEGSKFHMEKLRQYQLNRLKYYYAVVECNGPETADKLYKELDSMEYESSATQMDLRFIPDDLVFDEEPNTAAYKMPDVTKYEANIFTTTALQQAKVDLTWDETDPDRIKTMQKAFKDGDDVDLKAYLASSSEEECEEDAPAVKSDTHGKNNIDIYKELLANIQEEERRKKERDIDMEITWQPGLKEKTADLIKMKQMKELSPWEEYCLKKNEKKKESDSGKKSLTGIAFSDDEIPSDVDLSNPYFKELTGALDNQLKKRKTKTKDASNVNQPEEYEQGQLELLLMDENDNKKHFNLKDLVEDAKNSKRKKKLKKPNSNQTDIFQVDTADPRFAALYSSPLFNIDPSDPHFKKTKGIEAIVQEKHKKRHLLEDNLPPNKSLKTEELFPNNSNPALSLLVKSIKSKTQRFKR